MDTPATPRVTTTRQPGSAPPGARSAGGDGHTPRRTVTACSAVLAAALLLAACGGGGSDPAAVAPPPPEGRAQTLALATPAELDTFVRDRLRERVALQTSHPGLTPGFDRIFALPVTGAAPAGERMAMSSTLLQEAGVDEADLLKSDGTHLYALHAHGPERRVALLVQRRDVQGRAVALPPLLLADDDALDAEQGGLVLAPDGRALAVVTAVRQPGTTTDVCLGGCLPQPGSEPRTAVQRLDLSNPEQPRADTRAVVDGQLLAVRRLGTQLVVVTRHEPALPWDHLSPATPAAQREQTLNSLTAAALLPRIRIAGGAPQPLVRETDCWLQRDNAAVDVAFTTVSVFDLSTPGLAPASRCFAGGTEAVYMAATHLVLASTRTPVWPAMANSRFPAQMQTDLHLFTLQDGRPRWQGSGVVQGHLGWDAQRKATRLSWHDGHLRVLSFTGERGWSGLLDEGTVPPSPATLTVLRPPTDGSSTLQTVATLPNGTRPAPIGKPNEQVHGVRFVGTRGYVVTFRMVDPLYVLDLSDPADPRSVGELEVPGYSDHLFPLDERLLLGVGRDVDDAGQVRGVQLQLFDVGRPGQPLALQRVVLGDSGSLSTLDFSRHGLNWMQAGAPGSETARVTLPLALTDTPWGTWTQQLQRFEVNLREGTLQTLPPLMQRTVPHPSGLATERSLQIGDWVHHLHDGTVSSYGWDEGR